MGGGNMTQLFRAVRGSRIREVILQDIFVILAQVREYQHLTGSLETLYKSLIEDICTDRWGQQQEDRFERLQVLTYSVHLLSLKPNHQFEELKEIKAEAKKL
jgi:hypothetical protein